MLGFCGTFTCTLDDKGRLSIPAKIRPGDPDSSKRKGIPSGESMILTEGLDGCLSLYSESEWARIQERLNTLSFTRKNFRYFNRRLHHNTCLVRIDRSGRIRIPETLQKLAGLKKDVWVIGANQSIEIWDPERYQEYLDNFGQSYEDVAERLFQNEEGRELPSAGDG